METSYLQRKEYSYLQGRKSKIFRWPLWMGEEGGEGGPRIIVIEKKMPPKIGSPKKSLF